MPADTYDSILGLLLQATGNNNNTWGSLQNSGVITLLAQAVGGRSSHAVTGGTLTLDGTLPPAGPTAAMHAVQAFTGTLGSNQIVQVPNVPKLWLVDNQCSLATFSLKFKTASGSASAAIPVGQCLVHCDGSNNIEVGLSTSLRDIQWLGADGAVGAPGQSFAAEPTSGIYRKSAGVIGISILGTEIFEISATGVNVVAGNLSIAGVQPVPAGVEAPFAGITPPAGWLLEYGQSSLARAGTYANLFAAITTTTTGNTHANTTIDNLPQDFRGLGLEGSYIEGTGISLGTTIVSFTANSLTLSAAASGTNTGIALRFLPWGQGDGSTTFAIPDRRDVSIYGRGNMGGAAVGKIAAAGSASSSRLNGTGGAETVTLDATMIPAHTHTATSTSTDSGHTHTTFAGSAPQSPPGGGATNLTNYSAGFATGVGFASITTNTTVNANTGGGSAHQNMPPYGISNMIIKY